MRIELGRRGVVWAPLLLSLALPAPGQAQGRDSGEAAGVVRTWKVVPRVSVSETYTDNVAIDATQRQADFVTQISPGVRVSGRSARARLDLDYSLSEMNYARDAGRKQRLNYLNAFGAFEAVEDWLFVDFSGNVGQQNISAFGSQAASDLIISSNRTETSTFRFSPYVRGRIGRLANYQLRYSQSTTRSKSVQATDSGVEQWSAQFTGDTAVTKLRWSVEWSRNVNRIIGGRDNENDHLDFLLSYSLDRELTLGLTAGRGSDTLEVTGKRAGATYGLRLDWVPSSRTSVNAAADKRTYGDTYSLAFNHRTPLSAWRFSETRDVTILPNQLQLASNGSIYDLLFAQLASTIPDPALRAQQVEDLLRQTGISPNAAVTTGFFSTRPSLQRRQDASLVLNGVRNTVTYTLMRSQQDAVAGSGGSLDDFSTNAKITQRGFTSNWAYRLTPLASVGIYSSRLTSSGSGGAATPETRRNTLNVNVTTKLGAKSTASLAAGHSSFKSSAAASSDENMVVGTLTLEF